MADQKLTALSEASRIAADTLLYAVTDPGGTPTSQGVEAGNAIGWIALDGADISSPIESIELDLPTAYSCFKIELLGMILNGTDGTITMGLSANGGSTYYYDDSSFDAYAIGYMNNMGGDASIVPEGVGVFDNAFTMIDGQPILMEILVWPGRTSQQARVNYTLSFFDVTPNNRVYNGSIALTEATGRMNAIMLMPAYATGVIPPVPAGATFTAGSYRLLGMR